jgi:hypothetical protein
MTWLSIIKQHHKGIKRAFMVSIANPTKQNISYLKFLINGHSIAEEAVIYPQLSLHGMNDEDLEKEQTGAKEQIHYLSHHYDEPNIKIELKKLYKAVLLHALDHEEKHKFKELDKKLSKEENIKLGDEYLKHYTKWTSA